MILSAHTRDCNHTVATRLGGKRILRPSIGTRVRRISRKWRQSRLVWEEESRDYAKRVTERGKLLASPRTDAQPFYFAPFDNGYPIARTHFAEYVVHVVLHGLFRQVELCSNFFVGEAFPE